LEAVADLPLVPPSKSSRYLDLDEAVTTPPRPPTTAALSVEAADRSTDAEGGAGQQLSQP
jgi:hypothetical protein